MPKVLFPEQNRSDSFSAAFRNPDKAARDDLTRNYSAPTMPSNAQIVVTATVATEAGK